MQKENNIIKEILGESAYIERPLVGGMMNQSYIVFHNGKKYVLYMPTEQANEMVDRVLEKKCHEIIYSLGLTSKNIYFNTETGVKINEYIEGNSLNMINDFDINEVAKILKTLHNSGILVGKRYDPFEKLINYEKEASAFINDRSDEYNELRLTIFSYMSMLEKRPVSMCHNDSQRSNIVKSKDNKYYLIDFEFTYDNDPIYDIAAFGNGTVEEGFELLKFYYKKSLTNEHIFVFYLWRIFLSLQWHNVALIKHYRGEGSKHNINFLDIADFFLNNAKEAYCKLKEIKE